MTIVQPQKKSILNMLLIIAFLLLVLANITLVVLYNYALDLEYKIKKTGEEIKNIENQIATDKEKLFYLLSAENLKKIIDELGLVEEKNPKYFKIRQKQWQVGLNF